MKSRYLRDVSMRLLKTFFTFLQFHPSKKKYIHYVTEFAHDQKIMILSSSTFQQKIINHQYILQSTTSTSLCSNKILIILQLLREQNKKIDYSFAKKNEILFNE